MLFSYIYVPHQIEKMQLFVDYIFNEVWCKAAALGDYSLDAFNGNAELKEIMTSLSYDDTAVAYYFGSHIQSIYNEFAGLSAPQIAQFKSWYIANNDIENLCANSPTTLVAKYDDLKAAYPKLAELIGSFFKQLYNHLGVGAFSEKIGKIDGHYDAFMNINSAGKCPFCGISDILGVYHSKREAYDHYLPKALYPFNSVNFKNLVPACHHCNSSYKNSQDPAYLKDPTTKNNLRRKMFYPFGTTPYQLDIDVTLNSVDIQNLVPGDIEINVGPAYLQNEIDTWLDVYGIEERYKAKLCGESDGKYWYMQIMDEYQNDVDQAPKKILDKIRRQSDKYPYADNNFLKKAFLNACDDRGLFD